MRSKPGDQRFTDEQWEAVTYHEPKNVLVSASAGSGKTTVLVRRVLEKLDQGISIDRLLIVTYTEAAAGEMKERIEQALKAAVDQAEDGKQRRFLLQQLAKLPTASISTLHSFCLSVIRRYYYLIDLDPVFRMLTDSTEQLMIRQDIWEAIRDDYFEKEDATFIELSDQFSSDRNDEALGEVVQSMYDFSRSHPNPWRWLNESMAGYDEIRHLADHPMYQHYLKPALEQQLAELIEDGESLLSLTSEKELKSIHQTIDDYQSQLLQIQTYLAQDQLDALYKQDKKVKRLVISKKAREILQEEANRIVDYKDQFKQLINEIQDKIFPIPPEKQVEVLNQCRPIVQKLIETIVTFGQQFALEKQRRGVMDFSDLEHLTYDILQTEVDGHYPAREYYQQQFAELLIDEYQDINPLQEELVQMIANGGNRFMVGDVKQSIYSFRLADPSLFIDKYYRYRADEVGHRIILAENFRSRQHVLTFTNFIFQQLMDEKVGQLNYDRDAELVQGADLYDDEANYYPQILIYQSDSSEESEKEVLDKEEGQIYLVAQKIKELIRSGYRVDKKEGSGGRPIEYRDIAILAPTKALNHRLNEIFAAEKIPVQMTGNENYFQATEMQQILALLHVIDNPYQDIHLAAVLRSPFVNLSDAELASLRYNGGAVTFYETILDLMQDKNWQAQYPTTHQKVCSFLKQLQDWRTAANKEPISDLIWQIYQETGFLDYVAGLVNGKQRQLNLHALYQRAEQYEQMSFKGLFQFIRFIELMQRNGQDLAEPVREEEEQNKVQCMTIHASKGLEFPVVFCLNLTKSFNDQDLNQPYIFDNELGFGMKYIDSRRRQVTTLPYEVIRQRKKEKSRAEEMRKLYVALTRAKEQLYLVGAYSTKEMALKDWQRDEDNPHLVLHSTSRLAAHHLMSWIGMGVMRHDQMKAEQEKVISAPMIQHYPTKFSVQFYEPIATAAVETKEEISLDYTSEIQPDKLAEVKERFMWQYPHLNATITTGYQSVSEIKRIFSDPDLYEMDYLAVIKQQQTLAGSKHRYSQEGLTVPKFMTATEQASMADVGQATHLLLQLMPLNEVPTYQSLYELLNQQVEKGIVGDQEARYVPLRKIERLFQHPFGQALIAHYQRVHRERAFSLLMDPKRLFRHFDGTGEERVLVHGIIDGYIEYEDHIVLYDFKTNHFKPGESVEEFRKRMEEEYSGQLYLYKMALQNALHKKVSASYLVLLQDEPLRLDFEEEEK